jgi:hypothetical protein
MSNFVCIARPLQKRRKKGEKYKQKTKAIHPNPCHIGVSRILYCPTSLHHNFCIPYAFGENFTYLQTAWNA